MVCQSCGAREATTLIQSVVGNHFTKAALCSSCAAQIEPAALQDALLEAVAALRARAHHGRCPVCRGTFAGFKESGRFGCPNCYEHFLPQVADLVPRLHGGANRHRGKTPGRR